MASIWEVLMQALAPQEAAAKVVPTDPRAADLVDAIQTGEPMSPADNVRETNPLVRGTFDPLKKQIYQQILAAAQARPEAVTVAYDPTTRGAGSFNPETNAIKIDPRGLSGTEGGRYPVIPPTSIAPQETLSHELLHFLQKVIPPELTARGAPGFPELSQLGWFSRLFTATPTREDAQSAFGSTDAQHALIQYLLGAEKAPAALEEYTKQVPFSQPPPSDYQRDLLRRAFLRRVFPDQPLQGQALQGLEPR